MWQRAAKRTVSGALIQRCPVGIELSVPFKETGEVRDGVPHPDHARLRSAGVVVRAEPATQRRKTLEYWFHSPIPGVRRSNCSSWAMWLLRFPPFRELLLEVGDLSTLSLDLFPHLAFLGRCLVGRPLPLLDGTHYADIERIE